MTDLQSISKLPSLALEPTDVTRLATSFTNACKQLSEDGDADTLPDASRDRLAKIIVSLARIKRIASHDGHLLPLAIFLYERRGAFIGSTDGGRTLFMIANDNPDASHQ